MDLASRFEARQYALSERWIDEARGFWSGSHVRNAQNKIISTGDHVVVQATRVVIGTLIYDSNGLLQSYVMKLICLPRIPNTAQ